MPVRNILVPIDFSENALNGLNIACTLAKKMNATVHLLSAFHVPAPITDVGGAPQMIGSFISDYKEEIQDSLDELEKYVPELKNVHCEKDVFLASTIDAIYTAIESKRIDMIVMGTRKNHDGIEHLLGGVSTDVIRFAKCPVLVIPEHIHHFEPRKITLATDYKSLLDLGKFEPVKMLCRAFDASLTIVHVSGSTEVKSPEELLKEIDLKKTFEDVSYTFEKIKGDNTRDSLNKYIDETGQDLLVMTPRKHDLFERIFKGSLTKKIALDLHIPLLTIHE